MTSAKPQGASRIKTQQKTRDALIEAGGTLIARNGYAGASVRDIASLAGYTQGAFYSNFPSKDALVFAIMRRQFAHIYETLSTIDNSCTPPPADLASDAIEWLLDICRSDEKLLLQTEISLHAMRDKTFAQSYYPMLDEHARTMTQILEKIAETKQLQRRIPVEQASKGMIAMARGLKMMMPHHEQHIVADILRVFFEAILEHPQ
jgi:AcrR family transcriptional regulator